MPKIKLDSLEEGMVTAAEVRNIDNMLLLPAGCSITPRHINILRTWGVTEIQVESASGDDQSDPLAKLDPEEAQRLQEAVQNRFWKIEEGDVVSAEALKFLVRRKATKLVEDSKYA